MTKKKIPSVFVCMPTYDTMQVSTCLSLIKLMDTFTKAGIKSTISTFKCPYVGYGRNVLQKEIISEEANKLLYNFWDTVFDQQSGHWWGEDTHFSNIATAAGFKFYAVVDGETTHHGSFGFKGSLTDIFERPDEKTN